VAALWLSIAGLFHAWRLYAGRKGGP
jgi:hypothetical protein